MATRVAVAAAGTTVLALVQRRWAYPQRSRPTQNLVAKEPRVVAGGGGGLAGSTSTYRCCRCFLARFFRLEADHLLRFCCCWFRWCSCAAVFAGLFALRTRLGTGFLRFRLLGRLAETWSLGCKDGSNSRKCGETLQWRHSCLTFGGVSTGGGGPSTLLD